MSFCGPRIEVSCFAPRFFVKACVALFAVAALASLCELTALAQGNGPVYPPYYAYSGGGDGYYGPGPTFFSALGGTNGEECAYYSPETPTFGVPAGAGAGLPSANCGPTLGGDLVAGQGLTANDNGHFMFGETAEYATEGGVSISAEATAASDGAFTTASATYYQQNLQPLDEHGHLVLPGSVYDQKFHVNLVGTGAATFAFTCLWSDTDQGNGTNYVCQTMFTNPSTCTPIGTVPYYCTFDGDFSLHLEIGLSGRYTIEIGAQTLNEDIGFEYSAAIFRTGYPIPKPKQELHYYQKLNEPNDKDTTVRYVNKGGDGVGFIDDIELGETAGFEAVPSGSPPSYSFTTIVDPSDNVVYTAAYGINDPGNIVGVFNQNSEGVIKYHGFLLDNGSYTTYDVGAGGSTTIYGINNNGDFVGSFGSGSSPYSAGFLQMASGAPPATFSIPGATIIAAEGVNDSDTVAGTWVDADNFIHGFLLYPGSTPISFDFPGAAATYVFSITDAGAISGEFYDSSGNEHGFVGPPGGFVQYDLGGVAQTGGLGLNNEGVVGGTYQDKEGVWHGFSAQLCDANISSSVSVTGGGFVYNQATGEYAQQITLTNTSTQPIFSPFQILFESLPLGVILDNGGLTSICASPGAPYLTASAPGATGLLPGKAATVTANFANFSSGNISYTTAVLEGGQIP